MLPKSFLCRMFLPVAAISLALTGAAAAQGPTNLAAAASPAFSDTFSRRTTTGWNSPATTTGWSLSNEVGASVDGSRAWTAPVEAGRSFRASPGQAPTLDSSTVATLILPAGLDVAGSVEARRQADCAAYRAEVYVAPTGRADLTIARLRGGAEASLRSVRLPSPLRAGQALVVQLDVDGTNAVRGRARAWIAGAPVPDWQVSGTDTSAQRISTAGVGGINIYNPPTAPRRRFAVDDFSSRGPSAATGATDIPATSAAPEPNGTVTPAPVATPSEPPAAPVIPTTPSTPVGAAGPAGSLGSSAFPVPAGAIHVATDGSDGSAGTASSPVHTIARALRLVGSRGTIVVHGGRYHESVVVPAGSSVTIQAAPSETVWFDGARPVTGFTRSGAGWTAAWATRLDPSPTFTRGAPDNTEPAWRFVDPAHPMAAHPDQVWIDGVPQRQVGGAAQVVPGTFYVDDGAGRLYLGTDPAGRTVEAGDLVRAFLVLGSDTTIRGIGIRRYNSSVPDHGVVTAYAAGMTLDSVIVEDSATIGIGIARPGATLRNTTIRRSGMLGLDAYQADGLTLDRLEVTGNNAEKFNHAPSAGGIKITSTRGVTVRESRISDNDGTGLWLDESTWDATVTGNEMRGNRDRGVFVEISAKAVLSGNTVTDNAGPGITVRNSDSVRITENTILRNLRAVDLTQDDRSPTDPGTPGHDDRQPVPDPQMSWRLGRIDVTGNTLGSRPAADAVVAAEDWTAARDADAMAIHLDGNTYVREGQGPGWLVVWSRQHADPAVYTTLAAFRAAHAQETTGREQNG